MDNDDNREPPAAAAAGPAAAAAAAGANIPTANDAPSPQPKFFKLPDFWVASPVAWFGVAEAQFALREVTSQRARFGLVAAVLPEKPARAVGHILTNPPADCYDRLKAALLSNHQLTEIQKSELLFNMDALGARRPMDLLAEMLELVKPGEETTQLFAMLFIRKLPSAVRAQLSEDDHTDLRALAEKADRIMAMLAKQKHDLHMVAAVSAASDDGSSDGDEYCVAAIKQPFRPHRNGKGKQKQQQRQQKPSASYQPRSTAAADHSANSSDMCWYHFTFGGKATNCRKPCSWSGN